MDFLSMLFGLALGFALAYIIVSLMRKNNTVSKAEHQTALAKLNEYATAIKVAEERTSIFQQETISLKAKLGEKERELSETQILLSSIQTSAKNKDEKLNETLIALQEKSALGASLQNEINSLKESVAELNAKKESLEDKLINERQAQISAQDAAKLQFEKLANDIFEEKSGKFTETNRQNIESILKPLGDNIEGFRKKVEETYDKESQQRFSLDERIKDLITQTNQVRSEANNLTAALKGSSKKQGDWGEMILESVLQNSGLAKDREYFLQENMKDEAGNNKRPDALVRLPDDRTIIIDSKVSLNSYERYCSSEDSAEQKANLTEFIKCLRSHIDSLASKQYDDIGAALDFTMMFIPIEPAYILAMEIDRELWAYAYSKRIIFISPTNLIACLKIIADLWKRDLQSKNAQEIVKCGEQVYDQLILFFQSFELIGKNLDSAHSAYEKAVKQLREGRYNLSSRAVKLKSLGLKSSKVISPTLMPIFIDEDEIQENLLSDIINGED